MSWDIFVQDLPTNAQTVEDIPHNFVPAPIGKRSEIIQKIKDVVPFADFARPAWGHIRGESFSIEVNIGEEEIVKSFAFHVRGSDEAVGIIADILEHLGMRAIDGAGFFDRTQALERLRQWRAYRDQIINSHPATPPRSDSND